MRAGTALGVILLSAVVIAPAADDPAPRVITLDAIVVSATRTETPLLQSPVAVSVLSRDAIASRPVASIADLLRDLPGVMVADNSLPGMQRLRIRGEDARRCLVLIDGQEVSDHSTYGPPPLMDPAFVERIEVVRGPHSTLFGSRAEGGVVNIITRPAGDTPFGGSVGLSYAGATEGWRANLGATGRSGELDWRVGASQTHDGDRHTPSGVMPDTTTSSTAYNARLGWTRGAHEVALLLDHHELSSEASTPARLVDGVAITAFRMELPDRDRNKVSLAYDGRDLTPALRHVHVDAFLQALDRRLTQAIAGTILPASVPPTRYDYFNDDTDRIDTQSLNALTEWRLGDAHNVVAGLSWLNDDLEKDIHRTGTTTRGSVVTPVDATVVTRAAIATTGLFVQDAWQLAPGWRLNGGARQYVVRSTLEASSDPALAPHTNDDSRLVGSAALVFQPREGVAVRAAWSQGYVHPTLLHLHTGSLFGQGVMTRPNPTLRAETSENLELGARYKSVRFTVDLTGFATEADDYIASVRASTVPELGWAPSESTYTNLDHARTHGIELALSVRPWSDATELYAQGTWLRREVTYPTFTTTENGQPEYSGRAGVRWRGTFGRTMTWTLDTYGVAGSRSTLRSTRSTDTAPGWATGNITAGLRFTAEQSWWVGIELLNLFDEEYRPATDELVQAGRHANVSVRVEF